jgi:hypothetical protein
MKYAVEMVSVAMIYEYFVLKTHKNNPKRQSSHSGIKENYTLQAEVPD